MKYIYKVILYLLLPLAYNFLAYTLIQYEFTNSWGSILLYVQMLFMFLWAMVGLVIMAKKYIYVKNTI